MILPCTAPPTPAGGPTAMVKRSPCLCPEMLLSGWRPAPSQQLMPLVTAQLCPQLPSLSPHPGGPGWGGSAAGPRAELRAPRSPALLPGVPVVRGLRGVLGWRVCLHRGLLLRAGPGQGDQHRRVLVLAHCGLLHVSFLGLPSGSGRREAGGSWTRAFLSFLSLLPLVGLLVIAVPHNFPTLGPMKQSLFYLLSSWAGAQLGRLISRLRGPTFQQAKPSFLVVAETPAGEMGCYRPPEPPPHPCPFSWPK